MFMLRVELLRIYNRIYYKRKNNSYVNSGMISKTASIGGNCHLSKNVYISENVKIGNYTYFNSGVFGNIVVEEGTEIGSYCSIAPNVFIGPGNHPLNYLTTHPLTYNRYWMSKIGISYTNFSERERNTDVSNVVIKNDVWIGMNSIIMKGVTIGNGAVIAAGSVVTKNIPAYTIFGGVPAREIGKRFPEKTISMLENKNEKWWDWSPEKISNEFNKFYDIQLYLDS